MISITINIKERILTFLILSSIFQSYAWAYDFVAGGIYYNILSKKDHTVSVTYKDPRTDTQYFPSVYKGKVVVPSSVTYKGVKYTVVEIGKKAFCFGEKLTAVTIPPTVRSLRMCAFGLTSLTSLHIPASVVKIEPGFLQNSSKMKTITVAANNPYFKAVKNVLFNKDMTRLIYCTQAKRNAYTIPSSVKRLEDQAFDCCTILKLTIPSSVKVYVGNPFQSLSYLKCIHKAENVKHIPLYKRQKSCDFMSPGVSYREKL